MRMRPRPGKNALRKLLEASNALYGAKGLGSGRGLGAHAYANAWLAYANAWLAYAEA